MKRMLFVLLAAFLLSVGISARTYYITHVAGSSAWETNLILTNTHEDRSTEAHVVLLNPDGDVTLSYTVTLDAGATTTLPLQGHGAAAGYVRCASDFLTARIGFVANAATGGGTAEFRLATELSTSEILDLSNYYDQLTWAGFALFNGTDEDVTVTPRYITSDLTSHTGTPFTLEAREKRVAYFEDALGEPFTNLNAVIFETDRPALTAITISGEENEKLLFTRSKPDAGGWETVDTYFSSDGAANFHYRGQVLTPYALYYLVTTDESGYAFRNRLKGFDKWSGEFITETDFGPDFEARGIIASTEHNSIYVYGIEDDLGSGKHYYIYRFRQTDGSLQEERRLSTTNFVPDWDKKYNIYAATTHNTVCLAYQRGEDELTRVLLTHDLDFVDSAAWTMDTLLSDMIGYDNYYYLLYTTYTPALSIYATLNYYRFPYTSLTGMGYARTYDSVSGSLPAQLMISGAAIDGSYVRGILKANYRVDYAPVVFATSDLHQIAIPTDDPVFYISSADKGMESIMNADVHSIMGPDGLRYYWVSDLAGTKVYSRLASNIQLSRSQIIQPAVEGDDLYLVDYRRLREGGLESGDGYLHTLRVRKMKFADFITKMGP